MDCSPPGSSVHGIFQARILEWVAISFSRGSFQPRDWTHVSYVSCLNKRVLCEQQTTDKCVCPDCFQNQLSPHHSLSPWVSLLPKTNHQIRSDQLLSVQLCNPMNRSTPGLPVHHQFPEFTQTHVYRVSDAIQPSHPLSSPSPLAPNPSQHQSLFQWINSLHEGAKVLEFQL